MVDVAYQLAQDTAPERLPGNLDFRFNPAEVRNLEDLPPTQEQRDTLAVECNTLFRNPWDKMFSTVGNIEDRRELV